MKWFFFAVTLFVLAVFAWMAMNPLKGFGVSRYGLTTFELMPIPGVDIEVRADGSVHWVPKTHDLSLDDVRPALDPKPDALLIGTGWEGGQGVRPEVKAFLQGYNVEVLKTGEALDRYNELIAEHKRVAIRVHSTC